jgi:hypothetical protein
MPASLIPSGAAVGVVVVLWALGLGWLGVLTPADLRAWRRLAELRGYAAPRTRLERAASRISAVHQVQEELDLERMLACAQRPENPAGFVAHSVVIAFLAMVVTLVAVIVLRLDGSGVDLPPVLVVLVPGVAVLARFAALRSAARHTRETAGRTLGDMMMLVAVLTDGRGLQLQDAVRILARCAESSELSVLIEGGWNRLSGEGRLSTVERYRAVADRYDIPEFATVADALQTTHVGIAERDTYIRVAQSVYAARLAEARQRAARVRILVTLPVAGMLIPLLLLLGAPAFAAISTGLGGG